MILQEAEPNTFCPEPRFDTTEQAHHLVPEANKNNRFFVVLVTVAVLGAVLFLYYHFKGKKAVASPATATQTEESLRTMLSSANGCFAFAAQSEDQWRIGSEKWVRESNVATQHTDGSGGLGVNAVAQSFLPHCEIIRAIQVNLYPVGSSGWIRFQITEDDGGAPGQVLDTVWLRIDKLCPVPHGGYMIVPFADVAVKPFETYWFTLVEFRDARESEYHLTNLGVSNIDTYAGGAILLPPKYALPGLFDANFRIVKEYKSLPGIRAATDAEKGFRPSLEEQETKRNIWTQSLPLPVEVTK